MLQALERFSMQRNNVAVSVRWPTIQPSSTAVGYLPSNSEPRDGYLALARRIHGRTRQALALVTARTQGKGPGRLKRIAARDLERGLD